MTEQMQERTQEEPHYTQGFADGSPVPTGPDPASSGGQPAPPLYGDERDKLGTKVVKRNLKTADVWYLIRILGRVSKDARQRVLASNGEAAQMDIMALVLTEGVDKAQEEINSWFAELTGRHASTIDAEDIGFYMDVLEDLDTVGIDGFLGRLIPWYRKKFGDSGRSSSPSESTGSQSDTVGEITR